MVVNLPRRLIEQKKISEENRFKNFEKYNTHIKLFNIKKENYKTLDLFEEMISGLEKYDLECSFKLVGNKIYPCRFNIWYYQDNHKFSINHAFKFLQKLELSGVKINYDLIRQLITKDIDLDKISHVVLGIDLREDFFDSRVKFWVITKKNNYNLFNKALELHGKHKNVSDLIFKNDILLGFDFSFDNKTRIKIYPFLKDVELQNEILSEKLKYVFSNKVFDLIRKSNEFYVSFEGVNFDRIFHFFPNDFSSFLKLANNSILNEYFIKLNGKLNKGIISFKENEINCSKINIINFYY